MYHPSTTPGGRGRESVCVSEREMERERAGGIGRERARSVRETRKMLACVLLAVFDSDFAITGVPRS